MTATAGLHAGAVTDTLRMLASLVLGSDTPLFAVDHGGVR